MFARKYKIFLKERNKYKGFVAIKLYKEEKMRRRTFTEEGKCEIKKNARDS